MIRAGLALGIYDAASVRSGLGRAAGSGRETNRRCGKKFRGDLLFPTQRKCEGSVKGDVTGSARVGETNEHWFPSNFLKNIGGEGTQRGSYARVTGLSPGENNSESPIIYSLMLGGT